MSTTKQAAGIVEVHRTCLIVPQPIAVYCKFIGVAKIPNSAGCDFTALEIYRHPNGELFGVDPRTMAGRSPRIANFLNPEDAPLLDVSDEPRDRLLENGVYRFLKA